MGSRRAGLQGAVCPWWLCFTFDNVLRRWLQPPQGVLHGLLRPGQTALDLGCGMGYFTVPMARAVGENGKVIAADLQPEMLVGVARRAARAGLTSRIELHRCRPDALGLDQPVDFALAFWMLHEVPDTGRLLHELRAAMAPQGSLLIVEPKLHVSARAFRNTCMVAEGAGFVAVEERPVRFSRAVLFRRTAGAGAGEGAK